MPNFLSNTLVAYAQAQTYTFAPNSAVLSAVNIELPCVLRSPPQPPSLDQITQICHSLQHACSAASVTDYEFLNDPTACINYWQNTLVPKQAAIASGQCNYAYPNTADTAGCRYAAFFFFLCDHLCSFSWFLLFADKSTHCPRSSPPSCTAVTLIPCLQLATIRRLTIRGQLVRSITLGSTMLLRVSLSPLECFPSLLAQRCFRIENVHALLLSTE